MFGKKYVNAADLFGITVCGLPGLALLTLLSNINLF